MKIRMIFICIYACMLFTPMNAQNTVEKLVVYRHFIRGGTPALIRSAFHHPAAFGVDTTNVNSQNAFLEEFSLILSKSKRRWQIPDKMAGIIAAGEFRLDSVDHYFIIVFPNLLVDITDKRQYKIKDEILFSKLNTWINGLEGHPVSLE